MKGSKVRSRTRSIIVSAISVALVAWGGVSVALSVPAPPMSPTLACETAASLSESASPSASASPSPTPTPSCDPSDTPPPSWEPSEEPSEPAPSPKPVPAPPTCSEPPTEAEIKAVFDGWNDALANDADKVAARYATDAVLLSTLKDKVFKGRDAIKGYFVEFLKRKPQAKVTDRTIMILGDKAASDTGLYTFTFGDGERPATIKARFTFVYKVIDEKCMIVSHHSSKMPEG